MRKAHGFAPLLAACMAMAACLPAAMGCGPKVNEGEETTKVQQVIDRFNKAFETEDLNEMSDIIAHDADMVNFGTDAQERWTGWEPLRQSIENQFASFDSTRVVARDRAVKMGPSGDVAWFSQVFDWNMVAKGQPVGLRGARMTGVLEKQGGKWVVVQFHVSVPVSGQAAQY